MRKGLFAIIISIILWISMLNIISSNSSSSPMGWSEDIRLTNNSNNSVHPVIGVWENFIHIFWREQIPGPGSEYDIFYKRSIDGGRTWEGIRKLIDTDKVLGHLRVAMNQSTIHLVWWDKRSGSDKIYYTKSSDSGQNWEIERDIISPSSGQDPDIAVNGNNIHVVYMNSFKLYYVNSTDNGLSWSEAQQLTGSIRDSYDPAIAVNESNVHIVWTDHYDKFGNPTMGAIFYMNSSDGGLTWSEDINLTEMSLDACNPYILANGTTIHVVYSKEIAGLWQGYYRRSEDNGVNWIEDKKILESSNDINIDSFSIEKDEIHVVGGDVYISDEEIYYVKGNNNGQNWDDKVRITNYPEDSQWAYITVYNSHLYVVWQDYRDGSLDIYFKNHPVPFPLTNLTIAIQGTNLILNWTPPKNSPSPVDHYHIYRSATWDGFDFSVPWINTSIDPDPIDSMIIPLRTTWNDTFAFLDENNNYFYIVRAINNEGWNDTNTNIVGKYVIPMKEGWNMISLPLTQKNKNISTVLQTIDGNYDVIWIFDAKEDRWRSSTIDLTDINRTMGLWFHIKNACNLSVLGAVPESTDIALYEGWNLVGYPSMAARNPNGALSGINWQAVQHYYAFDTNDPWKHNSTTKPDNLNDLKEMKPGRGYWVYITINDTWATTRMTDDDKAVVWRVSGLEDEVGSQYNYESLTNNPIDTDEENDNQIDIVPEVPIDGNEENRIDLSYIPLIIIFAFVFAEIIILYKRRR